MVPSPYPSKICTARCHLARLSMFGVWFVSTALTGLAVRGEGPPPPVSGKTVYVSAENALLHSGPSSDYYPTCKAPRGMLLEVFQSTEDGWLGVRPPDGSFSWLPAADAYLLPGGRVLEVISDSSVSWIGSELGSAKQYRWQVQLNRGEQLAVRGEQTWQTEDGKEVLWYRIAPPAGEFRWIAEEAVSHQPVPPATAPQAGMSLTQKMPAQAPPREDPPRESTAQKTAAARGNAESSSQVVPAGYQVTTDDAFSNGSTNSIPSVLESSNDGAYIVNEQLEGEYVEGAFVEGDYIDGEFIEGEIVGEEYMGEGTVFEGEMPAVAPGASRDPFAGWHAMELGDDGMRFTLLERIFGGPPPTHDPLASDPYSLSMAQKSPMVPAARVVGPPAIVHNEAPISRDYRPWRDPRELRFQRSQAGAAPRQAPAFSHRQRPIPDNDDFLPSREPREIDSEASSHRIAATPTGFSRPNISSQGISSQGTALAEDFSRPLPEGVNWFGAGSPRQDSAYPDHAGTVTRTSLDIGELQVSLSEVVAQPMHLWSLQPIYDRAKHFVEHGSTPIERGQARLIIERIEEFAELARRGGYSAMNQTISLASSTASTIGQSQVISAASNGINNPLSANPIYDATGWLVPVYAASPGQPAHALTDASGKITAYITALPGMNLDRYHNQAVGITGLRGYLPQLQAGHVEAQRIVRLER